MDWLWQSILKISRIWSLTSWWIHHCERVCDSWWKNYRHCPPASEITMFLSVSILFLCKNSCKDACSRTEEFVWNFSPTPANRSTWWWGPRLPGWGLPGQGGPWLGGCEVDQTLVGMFLNYTYRWKHFQGPQYPKKQRVRQGLQCGFRAGGLSLHTNKVMILTYSCD